MEQLAGRYLNGRSKGLVLDLGSQDVNGCYRAIFEQKGWKYLGLDLAAGKNVDVILSTPYCFPLSSESADLVVSGQAFEHVEFFWLTWLEMIRVLKRDGIIILIAPSRGPEHRYPVDCWRFYPDGYRALAAWGNIELLEVATDWEPHPASDSSAWGDTVGVFRKQQRRGDKPIRRWAIRRVLRLLAASTR
jgi:SAM-dependent methyltransferase